MRNKIIIPRYFWLVAFLVLFTEQKTQTFRIKDGEIDKIKTTKPIPNFHVAGNRVYRSAFVDIELDL